MADKPTGVLVCAILFAINGILAIVGGSLFFGIIVGGSSAPLTWDIANGIEGTNAEAVTTLFIIFVVAAIILGIFELVVAYGIWKLKRWAKIAGIILAIIGLINIPVGTLISIIILYFLLIDKNTKDAFTQ